MRWKPSLFRLLARAWVGVALGVSLPSAPGQTAAEAAAPPPPILAGCEPDYPPYCIVTGDRQADGFSVELLRAALKAVHREVAFKTAPWAEIKDDLAAGRLQALPLVGRTPEREAIYDFTFPYLTMHGTIVVRADTRDILSREDLRGRRVAVMQGDNAEEYLRRAGFGAVVVPTPSFEVALRELSAGRHDAVVIQKLVAYQLIAQQQLKNLITVGPPLQDFAQAFCFAVRKGDSELLATLNEGLSLVMADGTFRALRTKWFADLEAQARPRSRIVVSGDNNYPPYEFLDAKGQPAGFNVDLTRAIARQMGLSVDIRLDTWSTIRSGLADGSVDVVQGMFYSSDRESTFGFSAAHSVVHHAAVVRSGAAEVTDWKDLAGKSVLVMAGDIMEDLAVKQGLGPNLVLVASQEEALRRLAEGKHDAALVARVPALYWIAQHGWRNLSVAQATLVSPEYCYAVPDARGDPLAAFAEGLAAVKATGEFRKIQAKWLGPYEESGAGWRKALQIAAVAMLPVLALILALFLWSYTLRRRVASRTRELTGQIAERVQAEAALRKSEATLAEVIRAVPESIFWKDSQSVYLGCNEVFARAAGFADPKAVAGKTDFDLPWRREDAEAYLADDQAVMASGQPRRHIIEPLQQADGTRIWIDTTKVPLRAADGRVTGVLGIFADITERKRAEEALQASLREKDALLKEVHHRVKNNLQVITSLLRLEARRRAEPDAKALLKEMQGRIRSMAVLHESLYRTGTFASVDLGAYLRQLATQSFETQYEHQGQVRLHLELAAVQVEMDQALPCGLLVNELLSNCLKHGFPSHQAGEIRLELRAPGDDLPLLLRVSDTGVGLPADFEVKRTQSLGLKLVSDLAKQLDGKLEIGPGPAAVFSVTFPARKPRL